MASLESGDRRPEGGRRTEDIANAKGQRRVGEGDQERDRYKREIDRGGGDLWNADDRPRDIARVILSKLSKGKPKKSHAKFSMR